MKPSKYLKFFFIILGTVFKEDKIDYPSPFDNCLRFDAITITCAFSFVFDTYTPVHWHSVIGGTIRQNETAAEYRFFLSTSILLICIHTFDFLRYKYLYICINGSPKRTPSSLDGFTQEYRDLLTNKFNTTFLQTFLSKRLRSPNTSYYQKNKKKARYNQMNAFSFYFKFLLPTSIIHRM